VLAAGAVPRALFQLDYVGHCRSRRGASRTEALRILPALAASGATTMVISYRNDLGAPAARDGSYHLGATEWQDLAAAAALRAPGGRAAHRAVRLVDGRGDRLNALRHEAMPGRGRADPGLPGGRLDGDAADAGGDAAAARSPDVVRDPAGRAADRRSGCRAWTSALTSRRCRPCAPRRRRQAGRHRADAGVRGVDGARRWWRARAAATSARGTSIRGGTRRR
jgi:hypothetical protein